MMAKAAIQQGRPPPQLQKLQTHAQRLQSGEAMQQQQLEHGIPQGQPLPPPPPVHALQRRTDADVRADCSEIIRRLGPQLGVTSQRLNTLLAQTTDGLQATVAELQGAAAQSGFRSASEVDDPHPPPSPKRARMMGENGGPAGGAGVPPGKLSLQEQQALAFQQAAAGAGKAVSGQVSHQPPHHPGQPHHPDHLQHQGQMVAQQQHYVNQQRE